VLAPSKLNERKIKLEWRHKGSDAYFDAYSLSDGTLRFICLATLLQQPNPPALILLDEPELGLHPSAIRLLAEMLESASLHTQILVATQSVTLVDHFPVEQIIVADHDGRASQFRRLRSEDYAAWLDEYSVGELWEKNVLGGNP
jgi:predicted ATPase